MGKYIVSLNIFLTGKGPFTGLKRRRKYHCLKRSDLTHSVNQQKPGHVKKQFFCIISYEKWEKDQFIC